MDRHDSPRQRFISLLNPAKMYHSYCDTIPSDGENNCPAVSRRFGDHANTTYETATAIEFGCE